MSKGPCPTCGTYHNPALTVDAVAVRGSGEEREVLLIRRGYEPWKGCWAFPGGFVDVGESPEDAVARELLEECNIVGKANGIIAVRGNPERDPRGHVVTIFYRVEVDVISDEPIAGDDAAHAEWVKLSEVDLENMGADHAEIIQLL
mgnify:FL=1|jgi:8-oxo-dGTP diphosphatase|tara:strand:+ start:151 stop:588 length:438 start_codon:yes stop_codon:yes gene_type:complete